MDYRNSIYKHESFFFSRRVGKEIAENRKRLLSRNWASFPDISGEIIDKYEGDEMNPSIEAAAKMAKILDVSPDYLVGKTDVLLDSKITKRIIEIQKLSAEEQKTVFSFLDVFLRDNKTP